MTDNEFAEFVIEHATEGKPFELWFESKSWCHDPEKVQWQALNEIAVVIKDHFGRDVVFMETPGGTIHVDFVEDDP